MFYDSTSRSCSAAKRTTFKWKGSTNCLKKCYCVNLLATIHDKKTAVSFLFQCWHLLYPRRLGTGSSPMCQSQTMLLLFNLHNWPSRGNLSLWIRLIFSSTFLVPECLGHMLSLLIGFLSHEGDSAGKMKQKKCFFFHFYYFADFCVSLIPSSEDVACFCSSYGYVFWNKIMHI